MKHNKFNVITRILHIKQCSVLRLSSSISILTFAVILLSCCFIPPTTSASTAHFQAKPSLDSDENIGKGIDEWPNSESSSNSSSVIGGRSEETVNATVLPTNSSSSIKKVLTDEEEEEEEEWRDANSERRASTRIAAVAVYGSVILIALFGVLVKYFVTQYENLQAKAQLEYQQLRNVPCH